MVSTWVGDHHGIPCAVRPLYLFQHGWQPRTVYSFHIARDAGPIPAVLRRQQTLKASAPAPQQKAGAFFSFGQPTHIHPPLLILAEVAPGLRLCLLHSRRRGPFFLLDNQHTSIRLCSFWQTLFLRHSLRLLPTWPPVFKTKDETQNHTHHI